MGFCGRSHPGDPLSIFHVSCLCFYTAEQSWRQNTQMSGDVPSCAVGAKYYPSSPSCYQLIYVTVQCLSCAKMETVGGCIRTHMQVILNRAKHNIMSSGPRGSMLGLPTATRLLCSQDGFFMLSLRVLTTRRLLSPAAESQT